MKRFEYPQNILMVDPEYFRVEYAINPHMRDARGNLNKVNSALARRQWENLRRTFQSLNLHVHVLKGRPNFPDMVFCANQSLTFFGPSGTSEFISSHMNNSERKGEVVLVEEFLGHQGLKGHQLKEHSQTFEGAGDGIWNWSRGVLFAGYGFRTQKNVYGDVAEIVGRPVVPLELVDERFYHLDTCFAVLNGETAAVIPEALSSDSLDLVKKHFKKVLTISVEEGVACFAGNCFSPDGKHVVLHPGAKEFLRALQFEGLTPIEVDTSEFMKSGGSVFCMKQVF